MPVQGSYNKPKEEGGSQILKILAFVVIIIIGAIVLFGFVWKDIDPISFVINIIGIILMIGLLWLAVKGILSYLKPKPFSPTESFRNDLIRISKKLKPWNVKDLYLRGEDMRTHAKWGRIIGVGFLPYLTSRHVRDEKGKPKYEYKEGKVVMEKEWSEKHRAFIDVPKPVMETIEEKDGDSLFVVDRNNFPMSLFGGGLDIIRCHKKFHSDIIGDIFIKAVNLVPYGEFLYPSIQWQSDIVKIMKENESHAIIQTHRNNLDLVSNVTQMSLGADPTFQKIMLAQSERLTSGLVGDGSGS